MSAEHADNAFLGIGWAFPPAFNSGTCSAVLVTDQQDIEQSLRILFSTHPGERVMQPEYGCALQRYVFSAMDEHALANIIDAISHAYLLLSSADMGAARPACKPAKQGLAIGLEFFPAIGQDRAPTPCWPRSGWTAQGSLRCTPPSFPPATSSPTAALIMPACLPRMANMRQPWN